MRGVQMGRPAVIVSPSLGRNPAAGATATTVIDVMRNQILFEKSSNQVDFRLIKSVRVAKTRPPGIFDVYNAFNSRPVLSVNPRYSGATGGAWRPARFLIAAASLERPPIGRSGQLTSGRAF